MDRRVKRHRFHQNFTTVFRLLLSPILKRIYAFRTDRAATLPAPFLVVANHVTAADPVLLQLSFRQQMYFVASEHLMQKGFLSRLLRFVFDPIVRRKGDSAVTAVKEMLTCLKNGQNVCVFPEGTCSFDGTNSPMLPTIGRLAKTAGVTLVTYRFEGGFFTLPRWGRGIRRGDFYGHIVNTYAPETLKTMSAAGINAAIVADLDENAYARQEQLHAAYRSRHRAEYLESAFFLCPACQRIGTLETKGDAIRCSCGLHGSIDEQYRLVNLPVSTLPEWDALQRVRLEAYAGEPDFALRDADVTLCLNDDAHRREPLCSGAMQMDGERFTVGDRVFALSEIADMELVRRNLLVFSTRDAHYQVSGRPSLNARKYMLLYHILKGTES